ncbi:hypothetical protein GCM10010191_00830 [Actinomadura vinacea]|uniref:Uncharacterized protein n=1 Tax=Actinomadura vinacea TaxID=115336 RepID=A0ABN3IAT4_9ACTN
MPVVASSVRMAAASEPTKTTAMMLAIKATQTADSTPSSAVAISAAKTRTTTNPTMKLRASA